MSQSMTNFVAQLYYSVSFLGSILKHGLSFLLFLRHAVNMSCAKPEVISWALVQQVIELQLQYHTKFDGCNSHKLIYKKMRRYMRNRDSAANVFDKRTVCIFLYCNDPIPGNNGFFLFL